MTDAWVIETAGLRKNYGAVEALRGVNLRVPAGSIFAFVGRNGAGKTTVIKILLGMVRPGGGVARVFGLAPGEPREGLEIRRRTGFVSEEKDLYDSMTIQEIIRFTAGFYPLWSAELEKRYLRVFELPADRKVKALSKGMRTKLALLLALCRGAELLILDEATSGLDPLSAEQVLQALIAHVAGRGTTVLFSSHQIAEVEQIADRVAVIDRGREVVVGALDDLRENYRRIQMVFEGDAPEPAFRSPGIERVRRKGRVLTLLSSAGAEGVLEEARNWGALSTEVTPVTLKEIFLETVGEE